MDISEGLGLLLRNGNGLHVTLGMEFFSTPEPDTCMASIKLDERHMQPFGTLNGGVSAALAETVAGLGSCTLCPDKKSVGTNVSCCHLRPAFSGQTITAVARIIHCGRRSHTWNVEIRTDDGRLISTVSVTNMILEA